MAMPTISPEALAFMQQELEKNKSGKGNGESLSTEEVFGKEDISNVEMTEDIAREILTVLKSLMDNSDGNLTIHDMKDIVSMFKDVGAYIQKSGGNKSSTSGLDAFIKRLKA